MRRITLAWVMRATEAWCPLSVNEKGGDHGGLTQWEHRWHREWSGKVAVGSTALIPRQIVSDQPEIHRSLNRL
jgi:hypothetical protein